MTNNNTHRRAKIVCTIGPSSSSYEKIVKLIKAGMDVARLNFSHGTHAEHKKVVSFIRKASLALKKPVAIMQDLQGPKIRVQTFMNGSVELKPGKSFILTTRNVKGNDQIVSVSYKLFNQDVKAGDDVLLDDGLLKLKVEKIKGEDVNCRVVFGGRLSDHKGINLPDCILSVNALTKKDREDLKFGIDQDVDYVALSFVQRPEDIKQIKSIIARYHKDIPVIAKIEKPQAVKTIDAITDIADAIMVARGDLGVELNPEEVPLIQKQIIHSCNEKGIPVITATQMLESMIHNPRPTRAEASDVANAVLDGTDAVMLSGETASGKYPVESVITMHRIVNLVESKRTHSWELKRRKPDLKYPTSLAIGYSASHAADLVKAAAIVCLTQSGSTARMIARFRPNEPIISMTPVPVSLTRMALFWGVSGYLVKELSENMESAIKQVKEVVLKQKLVKKGERIVITAGLPFYTRGTTNMVRIEEV
jgi:pyruvate kinase